MAPGATQRRGLSMMGRPNQDQGAAVLAWGRAIRHQLGSSASSCGDTVRILAKMAIFAKVGDDLALFQAHRAQLGDDRLVAGRCLPALLTLSGHSIRRGGSTCGFRYAIL